MAVRIYALAKELKLDSKELVDICTNAGITGKGSALASLSDEEVVRVKEFIKGNGRKPKSSGAPAPAPERPKPGAAQGKMPVIISSRPSPPAPPPAAAEPPAESPVAEAPPQTPPSEEQPPTPPSQPGPLAGAMRREDYIGPAAGGGKIMELGELEKQANSKRGKADAPAGRTERSRPAVKLAPLPAAETPPEEPAAAEQPAQQPDMRLPADVIGAGKLGSKPLAAHLRRHEKTVEQEKRRHQTKEGGGEWEGSRRGAKARRPVEEEEGEKKPMLGGREQRQLNRKRGGQRRADRDDSRPRRTIRRNRRSGVNTAAPRTKKVAIQLPCTVRALSEAAGEPAMEIQRFLLTEGVQVRINDVIDPELTELIAAELGIDVEFKQALTLEDEMLAAIDAKTDADADLEPRPPVITFLGHVDHGKTSLLDAIIGIDVVSGESGGITQHIRAYSVERDGKRISFVDTPGHEAFTEMRARGAHVTDIAVLVVAADDGVMPQTEEAISHARAAEVPIVVALNKVDLPGVDINRCMQQLSANELLPSEWGGDVEVVQTSATKGQGLDELLETLFTVAELHEYRANPRRAALGTCLESEQESGRGVVSKLIVQNGTLRVGDVVVCGDSYGRVKALYDTLNSRQRLPEAGPSIPVNLTGLDAAPEAGERFYVLEDIAAARSVAEERAEWQRTHSLATDVQHVTLENLFERLEGTDEVQTLNLILRADVRGSIEAIQKEFTKLEHPEVKIKMLQASVGGITEADVTLADASDAVIIGFNVVPDEGARLLAESKGVQIRRYEVIYKITEDLKAALEGMLKPEEREVDLGRALVQQTFKISRVGTVAGCRVLAGTIKRNGRARVIRDSTVIGDYPLDTLRREKDDVREVREGLECGIKLAGFNDIKEGDLLEIYSIEEIGRSFDD